MTIFRAVFHDNEQISADEQARQAAAAIKAISPAHAVSYSLGFGTGPAHVVVESDKDINALDSRFVAEDSVQTDSAEQEETAPVEVEVETEHVPDNEEE